MGELGAFKRIPRLGARERPPAERVRDHREFVRPLPLAELREQGARCMECGVPFCHSGCPLGNLIPDWNDLVYRDRFREAIEQLHRTNNFPELTGRLCPAPCEAACVLEIDEGNAVTIKQIELAIATRAWEEGWIAPQPPARRTGRSVAIVGSGPAGLACAQQLARAGHDVVVFERDEAAGGLLRFGIPDFKLEKAVLERRLAQLEAEGVELRVGVEIETAAQLEEFDAVVLAIGSRVPRDLPVPGRELPGVHFALEYLYARNRDVAGTARPAITAAGKHVVVIGGGDTGADCVASAHREGAASVTQVELLGEPPARRPDDITPWPLWPAKLRTSYALEEGGERRFSISTTGLSGDGRVERIHWVRNSGAPPFEPIPGSEESRPADLVLLAMGFVGPEPRLLDELGVERDERGNAATEGFATLVPGVFAAGDARRGQSLIVWAIDEGRRCAAAVDAWLEREPGRSATAARAARLDAA
ncbi:MAG: glutamate synthase subunit beta [Thermoleophilia bacterium]|nr:glutamate synthase subunit beta [Thermoleophilia bacterium]